MRTKIGLLSVILASALSSYVSVAKADNVLIVTDNYTALASRYDQLSALLTAQGDTIQVVSGSAGIAAGILSTLNNYDSIWNLRFDVLLSEAERTAFKNYVNDGGKLFLMGENGNTTRAVWRSNFLSFLNDDLGAGGVSLDSSQARGGPFFALPNFQSPNQSFEFSVASAGIFSNPGNGALFAQFRGTACGVGAVGPGAVWKPDQLDHINDSSNGLVVSFLDVNFVDDAFNNANYSNSNLFFQNLLQLVGSDAADVVPCTPPTPAPTITSGTYDAATGTLVVTGTNFVNNGGATNDVDVSLLTLTGEGGATYTLTSADVEIDSTTQFTITLNATDKAALEAILNKNGTSSDGSTTYNIAAAEDWMPGAPAANTIADLSGNGVTVSGIDNTPPVITGSIGESGSETSAIVIPENTTAIGQMTATDDVSASNNITWLLSGDDSNLFTIASDGTLAFAAAPDFEAPTDVGDGAGNNTYVVVVTARDAAGNTSLQTLTVTVTDLWDSLPGTVNSTDLDGDGIADSLESASADRDGDGVADARDYDPQGYLYCEDGGRILTGGRISVSGPNGSNNAVGVLNNIRIVKDGSDGEYQWFATAPGTYTMSVTYPTSVGVPSTTRLSSGTLDVTNLLPNNPASIGSSEFGTTGFLSNYWNGGSDPNVAANTTTAFYTTFEIEAGDPNVIGNNIPVAQCGVNKVSIAQVSDGAEANGDTTSPLIYTVSQTRVSTQDTVIAYRVAGASQATAGVDFAAVSGVATITAGQTSTQITVAVLEDGLIEGDEAVVLELTGITAGDLTTSLTDVAGGLSASALIVDDDFTDVVINEIDLTTTEGRDTDPAIVGLSLAGQPAAPVVMSITVDAQCTVSPSTLTFTADNFATEQRLTIRAVNDDLVEGTHSCQPIVSISSTDIRYHGFAVTMPQITIADDLVDQVRTPLRTILQGDFTNTVSAQSRAMSGISRGALGRLHEGANEEECQTVTPMAFDGKTTANEDGTDSAWSFDQDNLDCITGVRTITDGSFTLSKSDGSDEQGLFSMTVQKETQQGTSSLSGVFAGGYVSRTSLTSIGTGAVDGVGVMGGIYGARSMQNGLFVDYFAGGSTGVHRYDLSFYAPSAAIRADGDYSYRAIFAGAALSGEVTHEKIQIRPRLGFDIGRAVASDASVSARQLGQTDTGHIRLDAVEGARGYAEAVFSFGTQVNDENSEDAPRPIRKFEFAPRVFCEQSLGMSDTSCGGGASIRFTNSNPLTGSDLEVTLDLERTGDLQRSRIALSYTEQILGGAGSVISTLGTDAVGNAQIGQSVEIKF